MGAADNTDQLNVAGGGSGIGRFTCLKLARDGAHVVVTDVSLEAARQTLSMMNSKSLSR